MTTPTLACEQAIFTSIRTPMGEGYRLVAAGRGLRPEERQSITRHSPSHDAMCVPPRDATEPPVAASFYALPTGRLCVAYSCLAGAEHTGRGGQRVYTHNVIFDADRFADCGFNPFNVVRAMAEAGLTVPALTPEPVLPVVELTVCCDAGILSRATVPQSLTSEFRRPILQALFDGRSVIVDTTDDWLECAESLLLAIPGPARAKLSFGAGLRFSVGRRHSFQFLSDDKKVVKARTAGQAIEYIDTAEEPPPPGPDSAWITFVDRHWARGDLARLMRRTSRAFEDVSPQGRERIAQLYNCIDEIPNAELNRVLALAEENVHGSASGAEKEIRAELIAEAQTVLLRKLGTAWTQALMVWTPLVDLWRRSPEGTAFTDPLIEKVLRTVMAVRPPAAADVALDITEDLPATVDPNRYSRLLDEVLDRLDIWSRQGKEQDLGTVADVCAKWRRVRPNCPIVAGIADHCATALSEGARRA